MSELDLDKSVRQTSAANQLDGDHVLLRTRAALGLSYSSFGAYVQVQDSRAIGEEASTSATFSNLDLHQGYLELKSPGGIPLTARVGRQELAYGDQRLVGSANWANVGRSFDAALFRVNAPSAITVDAFWARLHQDPRASYTRTMGDDFFGLYGSMKREKFTVDAYGFMVYDRGGSQDTNNDGTPDAFRFPGGGELYLYTPGVRADAKPLQGLHLNGEFAYQFGKRGQSTVSAYALHAAADYTFTAPLSPKIIAGYNRASGDANATDKKWNTFDNLFPSNHDKYGLMDLAGWKNLSDPYVGVSVKPHSTVTVSAQGHLLSRVEAGDTFYRASGAALRDRALVLSRATTASHVGTELDLVAGWEPTKGLSVQSGYTQIWAGEFLKDTTQPGVSAPNPKLFYLQLTASL